VPELPEAETIVRTLSPHIQGRRILTATFLSRRVSDATGSDIAGRHIAGIRRYGKQILIDLDRGLLLVDLRMTGKLLANGQPGPYTRAIFQLDRGAVLFDDIRQFGSIQLLDVEPTKLGPDPLEIHPAKFAERLRVRNTQVKCALLDQKFVRGIGNIYADEALFLARIHPTTRANQLSKQSALALHSAIVKLLNESIALGGSSVSDYVDASGSKGSFQLQHKVYRKEGKPCPQCGEPITRIVVAQRGTHFCPRCQS